MMKTVKKQKLAIFIGAVRQADYLCVRDMGYDIALFRDDACPIVQSHNAEDFQFLCSVDFATAQAEGLLEMLTSWYKHTLLLTTIETSVMDHAILAHRHGFRAPTLEAAGLALDKTRMRHRFLDALGSNKTVAFATIETEEDLVGFAESVNFPLVLKPVNLFGSLFVSLCRNRRESVETYRKNRILIRDFLDRCGRNDEAVLMQAETFIEGKCLSIDVVVDSEGNGYPSPIVDIWTSRDLGRAGFAHLARLTPSSLPAEDQKKAFALAGEAVRVLGLTNCIAHVEMIMGSDGPKLLEVAARIGGGRNALIKMAFGFSLIGDYVKSLRGENSMTTTPLINASHSKFISVVSPFPKAPGFYVATPGLEKAKDAFPAFVSSAVRAKPGESVGPADAGFLPPAKLTLQSDRSKTLQDITCSILNDTRFYTLRDGGA